MFVQVIPDEEASARISVGASQHHFRIVLLQLAVVPRLRRRSFGCIFCGCHFVICILTAAAVIVIIVFVARAFDVVVVVVVIIVNKMGSLKANDLFAL